jgi:peptidoglycan-N-acetylglucosamine deacetylase
MKIGEITHNKACNRLSREGIEMKLARLLLTATASIVAAAVLASCSGRSEAPLRSSEATKLEERQMKTEDFLVSEKTPEAIIEAVPKSSEAPKAAPEAVPNTAPSKSEVPAKRPLPAKAPPASQKPPRQRTPARVKHKPVYYSAKTTRKVTALTFDDGPDDLFTPKVLDVLKQHKVKATFFLMGKRVQEYPNVVKRIVNEGHVIGNHTWTHPNLNKLNGKAAKNELVKTQQSLYAITGFKSGLFRPPYGNATPEMVDLADTLGLRTIRWSVDTRDWEGKTVSEMMGIIRKQLKPGGIILQHSAGGEGQDMTNTVELLKVLIPALRKEGYSFVTIPNLLDIPATAPAH